MYFIRALLLQYTEVVCSNIRANDYFMKGFKLYLILCSSTWTIMLNSWTSSDNSQDCV